MGVTVRSNWAADLLINYVTTEVRTLEPDLQFTKFGIRKDVPKGFDQLTFPQTNKIATSSAGTITEGQDPSAVTWGSTAYKVGPTQKGLVVQVSDLLVRNSAVEVIQSGASQVKFALMRAIDNYIQTIVMADSVVLYAGGKASRAALAAGDFIDATLHVRAVKKLRNAQSAGVKPLAGGMYGVIMHPDQETDLMLNTSTGSWIDVGRYAMPEQILDGKMDGFRGARVLGSANVQTFASTVTVYPALYFGAEAWGWGYFQIPEAILTLTPDSNNPLNVYSSIGAKATMGAVVFEAGRTARVESAVSTP